MNINTLIKEYIAQAKTREGKKSLAKLWAGFYDKAAVASLAVGLFQDDSLRWALIAAIIFVALSNFFTLWETKI